MELAAKRVRQTSLGESLLAASSKPHAYGIGGIGKKMRTKTPNGPVLKATILTAMAARIADLPSNS